jgi:HlyD family secretion protein
VAIGRNGAVLGQFRTLFNVGTVGDLTDGQLLERFATDRGESAEQAFAVLVDRHGPMVLRVCRGVLSNPHDTQDAFQATFLVLVRKARGLWVRDSLGPWLHQVAYRTASCARSTAARRRRHERRAAISIDAAGVQSLDELEQVLHEEINRLPERYRAPVVVCDLEGRTHDQAARHLGWPVGTVKSRLSRGRERLRDRLLRRGLTPDAGLIASALSFDGSMASIPTALVDSTAGAATRFLTVRSIVRAPAVSLAQGVLRSMTITRWLKAASVFLVAGATVAGFDVLAGRGPAGPRARADSKPEAAQAEPVTVFDVKAGELIVNVVERGSVEPSRASDFYCRVDGNSTIVRLLPEGERVRQGQLVCELDASSLKSQLVTQTNSKERAEGAYQTAKLVREVAEIAVKEYEQAISRQELDSLMEEIAMAQAAIRRSKNRMERARLARKWLDDALAAAKGARTTVEIAAELDVGDRLESAEQTLESEQKSLRRAMARHELIEKFTREKQIKELTVDVERKRADELLKQYAWNVEKRNETALLKKIENCSIYAPFDGVVVHASDPNVAGRPNSDIEQGATVLGQQKIGTIFDLTSPMLVNAKVQESQVHMIAKGLTVKIRVDAYPDEDLTGVVESVAPRPDRASIFSKGIKVYTTMVRVDKSPVRLVPGLTARVDILIRKLDNVLSVPVQAVLTYDGKDHLAVKKTGGGFEWREVDLGMTNERVVEVKEGIRTGEAVIVNPLTLLSDDEKRAKFNTPTKPAVTKPKGRAKTATPAKTPS